MGPTVPAFAPSSYQKAYVGERTRRAQTSIVGNTANSIHSKAEIEVHLAFYCKNTSLGDISMYRLYL